MTTTTSPNATPKTAATASDALLRNALRANAAFSALCATTILFLREPLSQSFGIGDSRILLAIALGLLPFAVGLLRNSMLETIDIREARIATALDLAWVAGSVAVLLSGVLTSSGNWAVVAVADIVGLCAIAQFLGVRRIEQQ